MSRDVQIALVGDVNLNIIDGAAIWLQSLAIALARHPRSQVTVICKAGEQRDLLTAPLHQLAGVRVVNPVDLGWSPGPELTRAHLLDAVERLDREQRFDVAIVRGFALCHGIASRRVLGGRLWSYLTDMPQRPAELTADVQGRLGAIVAASRYLLCQTEALRGYLEAWVPGVAGKAILLPPMIPDRIAARAPAPAPLGGRPLRLGYVGKLAPMWKTLEMVRVTDKLRAAGVAVDLHLVGDKIHRPREEPAWADRMEQALTTTPGVHWHRGRSRADTLKMLAGFDLALGYRDAELDDSLELSTKLLEYGAVGVPALINRTPMHEALFGADYPLYAGSEAELEQAIVAAQSPAIRELAAARGAAVSAGFTIDAVARGFSPYLDRAVPAREPRGRGRRVVIAGHDLSRFTRIHEHLAGLRGVEVRLDAWAAAERHDPATSDELAAWADVIVCEGCAGNALWYASRKRADQRLLIRVHHLDGDRPHLDRLDLGRVDRLVLVSDHARDQALAALGVPADAVVVIPNWVDTYQLDRPKVAGAIFNLGMLGLAPRGKRLDRALTVLERLRVVDDRFRLHLKGRLPWQLPALWADPDEQAHYRELFARINATPLLRDAVVLDGHGADVAAWLRKIGFVLSTSDAESFHLAAAEGMASRALPLLLDRPGAAAVFPAASIHADEDAVVATVLAVLEAGTWSTLGEQVRDFASRWSVERICAAWADLAIASTPTVAA